MIIIIYMVVVMVMMTMMTMMTMMVVIVVILFTFCHIVEHLCHDNMIINYDYSGNYGHESSDDGDDGNYLTFIVVN